jgi:uncharacterized protein (TIGR00299 family) protein
MKTIYFDLLCGASGDMILASLIDLGVPISVISEALDRTGIKGISVIPQKVTRSGIGATHLSITLPNEFESDTKTPEKHALHADATEAAPHTHHDLNEHHHPHHNAHHTHADHENHSHHGDHIESGEHKHGHPHAHTDLHDPHNRGMHELMHLIKHSHAGTAVEDQCERILKRIAEAEALVHRVPVEDVHFHEIGALDTLLDVMGTAIALDYLGIERIVFSVLTEGHGTITCDHGVMPVPAPATAEMMKGFAAEILDIHTEILTPTGCGILTAIGQQSNHAPAGKVLGIGYGCGTKVFSNRPNALRAVLIDTSDIPAPAGGDYEEDDVVVIESDMDHVSGEIFGHTSQKLFSLGALDVVWIPVFMKKGRPGYRISVIAKKETVESIIDCVIRETRTLGVRITPAHRHKAIRTIQNEQFKDSLVRRKDCRYKESAYTKPEYDDLSALAVKENVPLVALGEEWIKKTSDFS